MTNKCDLEEMKHLAVQKFLELADSDEWVSTKTSEGRPTLGNYIVYEGYGAYQIWLDWTTVFHADCPVLNMCNIKRTKNGNFNKAAKKKAEDAYNAELEAFNANPVVVAIRKVLATVEEKECRKQEARMLKAMEDSCKSIQAALSPPPTKEPSLYERVKRLFK